MTLRIEENLGQFIKKAKEPYVEIHQKKREIIEIKRNKKKMKKMMMMVFEASPDQILDI